MRGIFIVDGSIFIDGLVPEGKKPEFENSAKELINHLFKHKISGNSIAYMPAEAYIKLMHFFLDKGRVQTISLITNIIEIDATTYRGGENLSVSEAMEKLAYQLTLTPCKVYLITNSPNTYKKILQSERMFFVCNSKDALNIIAHPSFIPKDICEDLKK